MARIDYDTLTAEAVDSWLANGECDQVRFSDGSGYAELWRYGDGFRIDVVLLDEFGKVYSRRSDGPMDSATLFGTLSASGPWE